MLGVTTSFNAAFDPQYPESLYVPKGVVSKGRIEGSMWTVQGSDSMTATTYSCLPDHYYVQLALHGKSLGVVKIGY
jgi:hypothetical protein